MPMFGNPWWYHSLLRKYVITFGSMFANMTVSRLNADSTTAQTIQVPIAYSPKEKWLSRIKQDPTLTRTVEVQLPGMSFELTGLAYDSTRQLPVTTRERQCGGSTFAWTPSPWNLTFSLYIYTKNQDDGVQLLEQILPFFKPEWTNRILAIPALNQTHDIPTVLNSVTLEDTYEGNFIDRRAIIWTLHFTMKALLYGPVKTGGLIQEARVELRDLMSGVLNANITLTPGLTAAGLPTSNAAASIAASQIKGTDDYGFIIELDEYFDGRSN